MKFIELLEESKKEVLLEVSNANYKHKLSGWRDNDPKFLAGRERLVSSIVNILKREEGITKSDETVRDYVYKLYKLWAARSPKVKWIYKLEKTAKKLGFDPLKYKDQKPGDSAGVGKAEYAGRAFFFTGFRKAVINHFKKK